MAHFQHPLLAGLFVRISNYNLLEMEIDEDVQVSDSKKINQKPSEKYEYGGNLYRLKRWILFGCDEVHRSTQHRSINNWFNNDYTIRIFLRSFKMLCIRLLDQTLTVLEKDERPEAAKVKQRLICDIEKTVLDNAKHSLRGTVPFIIAQMIEYPSLRPVAARLIHLIPFMSLDMLLFTRYARKVKGNQSIIRKSVIEWYRRHSTDYSLIRDFLLIKQRFLWKHRDVMMIWHIPSDGNPLLKLTLGLKYDLDSIHDKKLREHVENCLKIRNLNSQIQFFKLLEDQKFMQEFGTYLLMDLKTQLVCKEAYEAVTNVVPDNDFIEYLPKILRKFPNGELLRKFPEEETLLTVIIRRLEKISASFELNFVSIYIIMKWILWRKSQDDVQAKTCLQTIYSALEKILISYPKYLDQTLFIVSWGDSDEEPKLWSPQRVHRPPVLPCIATSLEFLAILLYLYPSHRLIINNDHYEIPQSKQNISDILKTLDQIKNKSFKPLENTHGTFRRAIVFTFGLKTDPELETKVQKFKVDRMVVVTKDKIKSNVKDLPIARKALVIHGIDHNTIPLIDKCFTLL